MHKMSLKQLDKLAHHQSIDIMHNIDLRCNVYISICGLQANYLSIYTCTVISKKKLHTRIQTRDKSGPHHSQSTHH